jgi:geranylgeranyl reductase family protein
MDRSYDVVVVGGGPAGSAAADATARAGLKTVMIEEQAHIGIPVQCAGLLSRSAFDECRVTANSVLNTVSGATVIAGRESLSFDAKKTMAYVVDRSFLDREMAAHAAEGGADIMLKTTASRLSQASRTIITRGINGREEIRYRILIGADGPRAAIGRMAGLKRAPVYLSGLQSDIVYETDQDLVTIYPNASPEFFAWVIPLGAGRARAGLCGVTGVKQKFERFIAGLGAQSVNLVSGTIPLGTLERTFSEGLMVVGDAAALAKPTSGGGVYTGIRSARHAAVTAIEACEQERTDQQFLSQYEKRWKTDLGKELRTGLLAYKVRQHITPGLMEQVVAEMSCSDIQDMIVKKGDMDRPGKLISSLLFHPRTIAASGKILISAIRRSGITRKDL